MSSGADFLKKVTADLDDAATDARIQIFGALVNGEEDIDRLVLNYDRNRHDEENAQRCMARWREAERAIAERINEGQRHG